MADGQNEEFDLDSLNDQELTEQVHDDLYNGLKQEVEQATRIFLGRGWSPGVEPIGKIVIGTVKGDIHDIGKNLVSMMLEGAGFEVIDLGINNPVEKYLAAIELHQPDILGLSALLTTTMPYMKVVIDTLKEKGIRDKLIVLVGGAPLNEEFGKAIGADAYCRDAAIAVETAKSMVAARRAAR
jgi:methylmalonyl-CoA mutase cobalamin-binding domain/chain